uniref:Uncharacterized protein n=1 Tax=Opuntia streptacantha TaxID=393608 RepID=A0A7C9E0F3_OPUST
MWKGHIHKRQLLMLIARVLRIQLKCIQVPVLALVSLRGSISLVIMRRNPSWVSSSTPLSKPPSLLLSPTAGLFQSIHSSSPLMLLFCLTKRLFMTLAGIHLTLSAPHSPTLIV